MYIHPGMERLNYHHLLYFFTVAREGSVARASARLGLKQPTVSAQIHALEEKLGRKLLERSGRGLKVTPDGETVLRFATSIFVLGDDLMSALDGNHPNHRPSVSPKLAVGVASSLPPALVTALLQSIFQLNPRPVLAVVEDSPETLAKQLVSHVLHFALSDVKLKDIQPKVVQPKEAQPGSGAPLHSRLLLESAVEVFAPVALARKLAKDFPARLDGTPVLLPSGGALRSEVESWLALRKHRVLKLAKLPHPEMYAAAAGAAVFAPSVLRQSLKKSHGLLPVGELEGVRFRVFVLTGSKSFKHPALDAVTRAAKELQ